MSLLSPDRVLISLAPAAVHVVQLRGKKIAVRHLCQGALDALQEGLAAWDDLRGEATVVLSNAFVRYAVVPHAGEVTRTDERIALSRAHFTRIYGDRVREWELRIAPCARGEPGLAIAVDAALLEALKLCFHGKRHLRLVSVQPYLMSAFNRWRARVPAAGAWLVLMEPDRTCVALLEGRRWHGVSVTRESVPAHTESSLALVERERARMAAVGPPTVLANMDDVPYGMALSAQ